MDAEQKLTRSIDSPIKTDSIEINGYHINYVRAGTGKPLLLIHALNIGWGEWYPNIAELAKHFTVYAIDLPGSGKSTKIDFTKMSFENDFLKVLESFIIKKNLKDIRIIGHSSGALIALRLLQRQKITTNKIVCISPMGFTHKIPKMYILLSFCILANLLAKTVMKPTQKNMRSFLTSVMIKKHIKHEFVDYYIESITKETVSHPFLLLNSFLKKFELKDELLIKNGRQITNKTLIIVGDKDPNMQPLIPSDIKTIIPFATIEVFHNCGHVPSIEYSDKFNEKVIQFII